MTTLIRTAHLSVGTAVVTFHTTASVPIGFALRDYQTSLVVVDSGASPQMSGFECWRNTAAWPVHPPAPSNQTHEACVSDRFHGMIMDFSGRRPKAYAS